MSRWLLLGVAAVILGAILLLAGLSVNKLGQIAESPFVGWLGRLLAVLGGAMLVASVVVPLAVWWAGPRVREFLDTFGY